MVLGLEKDFRRLISSPKKNSLRLHLPLLFSFISLLLNTLFVMHALYLYLPFFSSFVYFVCCHVFRCESLFLYPNLPTLRLCIHSAISCVLLPR